MITHSSRKRDKFGCADGVFTPRFSNPPIDVTTQWPPQIYSNEKFEAPPSVLACVLDGRRRLARRRHTDAGEGRELHLEPGQQRQLLVDRALELDRSGGLPR